jgi:hypothetical protein
MAGYILIQKSFAKEYRNSISIVNPHSQNFFNHPVTFTIRHNSNDLFLQKSHNSVIDTGTTFYC